MHCLQLPIVQDIYPPTLAFEALTCAPGEEIDRKQGVQPILAQVLGPYLLMPPPPAIMPPPPLPGNLKPAGGSTVWLEQADRQKLKRLLLPLLPPHLWLPQEYVTASSHNRKMGIQGKLGQACLRSLERSQGPIWTSPSVLTCSYMYFYRVQNVVYRVFAFPPNRCWYGWCFLTWQYFMREHSG